MNEEIDDEDDDMLITYYSIYYIIYTYKRIIIITYKYIYKNIIYNIPWTGALVESEYLLFFQTNYIILIN